MVSNKINEYKDAAIITIITVKNRINDLIFFEYIGNLSKFLRYGN